MRGGTSPLIPRTVFFEGNFQVCCFFFEVGDFADVDVGFPEKISECFFFGFLQDYFIH